MNGAAERLILDPRERLKWVLLVSDAQKVLGAFELAVSDLIRWFDSAAI